MKYCTLSKGNLLSLRGRDISELASRQATRELALALTKPTSHSLIRGDGWKTKWCFWGGTMGIMQLGLQRGGKWLLDYPLAGHWRLGSARRQAAPHRYQHIIAGLVQPLNHTRHRNPLFSVSLSPPNSGSQILICHLNVMLSVSPSPLPSFSSYVLFSFFSLQDLSKCCHTIKFCVFTMLWLFPFVQTFACLDMQSPAHHINILSAPSFKKACCQQQILQVL